MNAISWIYNDVKSLTPFAGGAPAPSPLPHPGDPAPSSTEDLKLEPGRKTIVAFQRHSGCPFAEKTIRQLVSIADAHPSLSIHIVLHSDPSSTTSYISSLLPSLPKSPSSLPDNIIIHADPDRTIYSKWGIGQLGWTELFARNTLSGALQLAREEGIKNRYTVGSRWQNHGTFAVDEEGKVRYAHVGKDAGDMTDLEAVTKSLLS